MTAVRHSACCTRRFKPHGAVPRSTQSKLPNETREKGTGRRFAPKGLDTYPFSRARHKRYSTARAGGIAPGRDATGRRVHASSPTTMHHDTTPTTISTHRSTNGPRTPAVPHVQDRPPVSQTPWTWRRGGGNPYRPKSTRRDITSKTSRVTSPLSYSMRTAGSSVFISTDRYPSQYPGRLGRRPVPPRKQRVEAYSLSGRTSRVFGKCPDRVGRNEVGA